MLTSIVIPSGVTSIGDRAFANCSSLTGIEIPSSMTSIGDDAFSYCTSLTSVTFGENSQLTSIGDNAFCYCNALTSIVIPSSVTSIGNGAFWGCSSLESMTLPFVGNRSGVTASDFNQYPLGYIFGEYEYAGGTIVTQNYYLDSLQTTTATNYCIPSSLTTIKILGGAILRGGLQNCTMLQTISLEDEVTMVAVNAVRNCTNLTSVYIGEKVSAIGYGGGYAFAGCTALSSVTFSENSVLTNFTGGHNFANCPIVSIEIPAGITNLSANNFEQCKKLTTVIFRSSNNLTIIGVAAFTGCELLSTINIPLSLTTISNYAFSNCSALPSIILPSSLTTIGNSAFLNCSNLITINFMGTESQWNAISKGTSWDSGMPANYTVVYNYSPS